MKKNDIRIFPNPLQAASALAMELQSLILSTLKNKKSVSLAVSGGSTPALLFSELANKYADAIPWKQIHLFWVDERCVPPADKESNYGMTKEILLNKIKISADNIHRIIGENDPKKEAERYSREIESILGQTKKGPVFDIILLGMGNDGHTASIFPDMLQLFSSPKIAETTTHPDSGQKRVTLTGKTINNASHVIFSVNGGEKSGILSSVINKKTGFETYPAAHVNPSSDNLSWYLDDAATRSI